MIHFQDRFCVLQFILDRIQLANGGHLQSFTSNGHRIDVQTQTEISFPNKTIIANVIQKLLFYAWQRFTLYEPWDVTKEKCLITWYPGTQRKLGTPSIGLGSFWILSKWSAIKAAVCMSVILFFCNIVQKGLKVFTHSLFEILNSPRCCGAFPCFPATKASNFPLSLIFS